MYDCAYTMREYEWDPAKDRINIRGHHVAFADAAAVFADGNLAVREDPDSDEERRWLALGMDALGRLLVVVYSWRGEDRIRIISARKATPRERAQYGRGEV